MMDKDEMIKSRKPYGFQFVINSPFSKTETRARTAAQVEAEKRRQAIDESIERKRLEAELRDVIDE